MSWYLFKQSPTVQSRGKKVDGFQFPQRDRINLLMGTSQKDIAQNSQSNQGDIIPATMTPRGAYQRDHHNGNNVKVLTETSDDEQQELMKLIRSHKQKKIDQEVGEMFMKNKAKSQPYYNQKQQKYKSQDKKSRQQSQKGGKYEMDKRIRYLQNSLLPASRRNSIATILDHDLNREVPLGQSRVSGKSVLHNKSNDSNVVLGDGYNPFHPPNQPQMEYNQKLKDLYDYDQSYKKRVERSNIRFG